MCEGLACETNSMLCMLSVVWMRRRVPIDPLAVSIYSRERQSACIIMCARTTPFRVFRVETLHPSCSSVDMQTSEWVRPHPSPDSVLRLQDDEVAGAVLLEAVGGRDAGHASTENQHLGVLSLTSVRHRFSVWGIHNRAKGEQAYAHCWHGPSRRAFLCHWVSAAFSHSGWSRVRRRGYQLGV